MLNIIKNKIITALIRKTNIDVGVIYEILSKTTYAEMKHYFESFYNEKDF